MQLFNPNEKLFVDNWFHFSEELRQREHSAL